jgi:16S rRNA (uracil1498-N3)-methyltransferase
MLEGAAQGSTTLLPQLVKAASLREAIERHLPDPATRIVLHGESDREGLVRQSLSSALGSTSPAIVVAVGSERGWSPSEIDFLTANGFQAASLGDRVLRTENAALVACWAACEACAERGRGGAGGSARLGAP